MSDYVEKMIEMLADNEHTTWSSWMLYLFEKSTKNADGTMTIPKWAVDGWTRQANTLYAELSEEDKEKDRREVREVLEKILATLPSEKEIAKGVVEEWVKEGDKDIYPWNDDMKALFGSLMYFLSKEAE